MQDGRIINGAHSRCVLAGLIFLLFVMGSAANMAHAQASGQISANPNPVVLPVGTIIGNTTISWSTFNSPYVQLWLRTKYVPELFFSGELSGSAFASWIVLGDSYDFNLYASDAPFPAPRGQLLASVTVAAQQGDSNHPPGTPTVPSGPASGNTNVQYTYSASSFDPDGDTIKYGWDWNGDGIVDEWSDLMASGSTSTRSHTWSSPGNYYVRVKAQDSKGSESAWSQSVMVSIIASIEPHGTISASPNPVTLPYGTIIGSTTITWASSNTPYVQLWLRTRYIPEFYFSGNLSGSASASWIVLGDTYEFNLYAASAPYPASRGQLLASVTVTAEQGNVVNNPPTTPSTPSGPSSGNTGVQYAYSASSFDPDGDSIKYGWDWNGDGIVDEWSDLMPSGSTSTRSHSWSSPGNYYVRVKAQDSKGSESAWSQSMMVSIITPSLVNGAQFITQSVPATMVAGQSYNVSVTMSNTGTTTWTKGTNYRLGSQNPQDNSTWGSARFYLSDADSIGPGQQKTFTFTVTAPAAAGTYNFQSRMVQEAIAWFGDYSPNVAVTVTAPIVYRDPDNPPNPTNGLDYAYYEGYWQALPSFDSLTPTTSGTASTFDIGLRLRNDYFGFRFSGFVQVPQDGVYTFYTASDDGSRLFIGNTMVVNNDGLHPTVEASGTIGLKAGMHAIRVEFFEYAGGEALQVSYQGPGISKQPIPAGALFHKGKASLQPAAGVNTMNLFSLYVPGSNCQGTTCWDPDYLKNYQKVSQEIARKATRDAANAGAKFIRVSIPGFGYNELLHWQNNPDEHWQLMSQMLDDVEAHNLKIVPVFIWWEQAYPYAFGGSVRDMITNPNAASYLQAKAYMTDFITRYKDRNAIYFYELTNELNLTADITTFSTDEMTDYLGRLAAHIRSLDSGHFISSGFGCPRINAYNIWKKGSKLDTEAQTKQYLQYTHQSLDIMSCHPYTGDAKRYGRTWDYDMYFLDVFKQAADEAGKYLYLGELGDVTPNKIQNPAMPFTMAVLDKAAALRIPVALWDFEFYNYETFNPDVWFDIEYGVDQGVMQKVQQTNVTFGYPPVVPQNPDTTPPQSLHFLAHTGKRDRFSQAKGPRPRLR